MNRFTLKLFVAVACLLLDAGVSGFKMTTCGPHVHRLTCETGVINVTSAFFGRADIGTCAGAKEPGEVTNTQCSLDSAMDLVTRRCTGKKVCELNANCFDHDPCPETFKYIQSTYTCIPAIHMIVCEQSLAHLECDNGKTIHVIGADFGRRDHVTCGFRRDPALVRRLDCTNPIDFPGQKCNRKSNCEFRASKSVLGSGCAVTSQYLELAYTCQ
ncbi:hypothetical protein NL108_017999 [Boleophthalmus pectinirostris]|uniref:L-rhamnose-binding lectin SML-like n=1 Tax=Boleophthalmus pectinirostris TaxID=150288 RepID=UPI000A1C558A|nr:L-rhamnose-binding lectin SML-like [Boleophthalmus pectinirostris]KAJ0037165.1 hypothetical protein NL108_017999 [Boleophthalmus pectinirostris]